MVIILVTPKELLKVLKKDGWYVDRIRGSHHMLKHTSKVGRVTVPVHKEDLKPKTLHTILKQAGIK
ncbi:type II toxin-antitoxin system HicA family toxin [Veillonella sp. DNF00869]|jgi:ycfA family protein|uniref:type II toxin-antitoxin system HicA family toxin n=1 Tax=Veillonella sp. DNF00869 TaxID=1384081 RepID=UPI000785ECD7|nr:type II toxin-antitoxin system HicA family toxin [Veillonella sp. DNF00869]KXB87817.1 toxin-antitoxin system, toxin component, HicA family [Veillonella sp. DNF00869]